MKKMLHISLIVSVLRDEFKFQYSFDTELGTSFYYFHFTVHLIDLILIFRYLFDQLLYVIPE